MRGRVEPLVVAVAAAYVAGVGWAMATVSYDVWGALVVAPVLVLVSLPLLRRALTAHLAPLLPIAVIGLLAKFAGAALRYWVAFDAYGGSADAARYHSVARTGAAEIRSGAVPITRIIPRDTGTEFIQEFTTSLYTVFGSSRLAGFVWFSWMAFWGALFFVKAAVVAVPGLARRRYAALVFLAPSMVYWPSSIGKEAWIMLCLGVGSFGAAHLLRGRWGIGPVLLAAVGIGAAGWARPHFATLWVGALVAALVAGLLTGSSGRGLGGRLSTGLLVVVAAAGLFVVATATMRFLKPIDDSPPDAALGERISSIFGEAERRTGQGGSSFEPIRIDGPLDWPVAVFRTLTRPLPTDVDSLATALPAVEMTALLVAAALGWRRFANLPRMMVRNSYVVFAVVALVMFGLAYARFGNLGILTRQRSLVMPLLLLLWCLPARPRPSSTVTPGRVSGVVGAGHGGHA